jgi:chemotaxis signal transduction protein
VKWFAFRAGVNPLAMETRFVYRVVDELRVAPVPLMPACHLGLTHFRGELFDIIHLVTLLEGQDRRAPGVGRSLLVKWPGHNLGLVVDEVRGISFAQDVPGWDGTRLITPQEIWERLTGLAYGRREV